jgi:hypothetical protein
MSARVARAKAKLKYDLEVLKSDEAVVRGNFSISLAYCLLSVLGTGSTLKIELEI